MAAERGLCWNTVKRAKQALGVVTKRINNTEKPVWVWRLPSMEDDGDALRCSVLRAMLQMPKKIKEMHELMDEGDRLDVQRIETRRQTRHEPPEG